MNWGILQLLRDWKKLLATTLVCTSRFVDAAGTFGWKTRLTDHLTLGEQNSIGEEITDESMSGLPFANVPYGC